MHRVYRNANCANVYGSVGATCMALLYAAPTEPVLNLYVFSFINTELQGSLVQRVGQIRPLRRVAPVALVAQKGDPGAILRLLNAVAHCL